MNTTRNTLISALALAGALYGPSAALGAAPDVPTGQRVAAYRGHLQNLATELNLTQEQKQQLQPIWQEQMPRLRALWQDRSHPPGEKLAKFRALQQALEPKLKRVLTAEQFEQWQQQRGKMREQAQRRWQRPQPQ